MLTIKCAKCKRPVFNHVKVGEGQLLRCYKSRIVKDYSLREGDAVRSSGCGNLIGVDEGRWIKDRHHFRDDNARVGQSFAGIFITAAGNSSRPERASPD